MSKEIDQRIVEMRFDNKQFESNVSTSMSTLDKLSQKLKLTGATKGLEDVSSTAKKIDLSPIGKAADAVSSKFSALEVAGITALANITNSAVNTGKAIVSAFTIDPIKTGFQEYETQINAVQTILANTSHQGTTLSDVNAALDELNTYADMTIYNFTEMTRNIGTFTAAGLDLQTSTEAIKGIANLAAVSGSTSQQASNAMYQLSQALAAGTVSLQDWNSVVNAGMGGKVFQDALIRTAAAMQGVTEETFRAQNVTGSFRESINAQTGTGWLTAEVLSQTLRQFTGDLSDAELAAMGFTDAQIENIQQMAVTANDAATKVKTFSQLWDTLKETAQSGWTQTWEILVGDFEEAKDLLTELSDIFGELIGKQSEARNTLLYDSMTSNWKKLSDQLTEAGYSVDDLTDKITDVAKKHKIDIDALIEDYGSLEKAFKNGAISSDILNEALSKVTGTSESISKEMEKLELGLDNNAQSLRKLVNLGVGYTNAQAILADDIQGQVISLNELTDVQLKNIGYTDEQILSIRELSKAAELASGSAKDLIDNIAVPSGRELLIDSLRVSIQSLISIFEAVGEAWRKVFPPATADQVYGIAEALKEFTLSIRPTEETLDKITRTFRGLFAAIDIVRQAIIAVLKPFGSLIGEFGNFGGNLLDVAANLGDYIYNLDQSIKSGEGFSAVTNVISDALNGVSGVIKKVSGWFGGFSEVLSNIGSAIVTVFGVVKDVVGSVFNWIRENISAGDIFAGLAGGGIYVAVKKFSGLIDKIKGIFDGFLGDESGGKFSEVLESIHSSLESFQQGIKVASLVGIAAAVMILSSALKKISEIEPVKLAYSLAAIEVMLLELNGSFSMLSASISKFNSKGLIKASIALIAISISLNKMADAIIKIGALDVGEIAKGLTGVGGALTELVLAIKFIDGKSINLRTSIAILAIAEACKDLSEAVTGFSNLNWGEIARGLTAMGGALGELVISLSVLNKAGGFGSLLGSVGILIAVQSLDEISENLKRLGSLSWEEIGKGLTAMGGALTELTVVLSVLSKVGGFGSLLGGSAILIAVQSLDEISENLKRLGSLSWEEIGKGLAAMGGALAEIGVVTGALGKLAGFSGILGSISLLISVQSLEKLYSGFKSFAEMSWEEIGKGLVAMGGALLEVGAISGALGYLTNFAGILGAASLWVAIQGLNDLAIAFAKFGSMSWEEIGKGLVAMGGALLEVGAISGALGYLTNIAGLVGAGTLYVAIQALDDLAVAFAKFGGMSWDEIGRGLAAMGGALAEIAAGSLMNTFSFFGASSITEMAESLGILADSVRKWIGVDLPSNLSKDLIDLASGVVAFNFSGWGADAIATIAEPLGTLANSIMKWSGVSLPSDLKDQLRNLADGITSFTLSGWGADAFSTAASGLVDLATAFTKWDEVYIPENLGDQLSKLADGVTAFTWSFMGGWSMNAVIDPLAKLVDSILLWKDVTIPENIGRDLSNLADGILSFTWAFMGGWSMSTVVDPLAKLVDSVNKWNDVSIPADIGDNLSNLADGIMSFSWSFMGGWSMNAVVDPIAELADSINKWKGVYIPINLGTQLSNLADGVYSFNFTGWGADAIGDLAGPIGNLADSINKWKGVYIPINLGTQLGTLADGVYAFNFTGWGADAISSLAGPLGRMATSISKWSDVAIPETLGTDLKSLSDGVYAFNFTGWGVDALSALCEPIKILADSIKAWSDVTIPETLGTDLKSLSGGIYAFNFSGWGANAISDLCDPLGTLASSVKEWTDVTVSSTLGTDLMNLADGVSSFNFSGWGADAINKVCDPLGLLSDSVAKWTNIVVPDDIGTNLSSIASGISSFNFTGWGSDSINSLANPLGILADSITKWTKITVPENIQEDLQSIASGVSSFNFAGWGSDNLGTTATNLSTLADSITKLSGIDISSIATKLTDLSTGISNLIKAGLDSNFTKTLSSFIEVFIGDNIGNAINSISTLVSALKDMSSVDPQGITSFQESLNSLGKISINGLVEAIQKGLPSIAGAIEKVSFSITGSLSNAANKVAPKAQEVGKKISSNITYGIKQDLAILYQEVSLALSAQANSIGINNDAFKAAGTTLGKAVVNGFNSKLSSFSVDINSSLNKVSSEIANKESVYKSNGISLVNWIIDGAKSQSSNLTEAFDTMLNTVIESYKNKENLLKSTSQDLMSNFISGIGSKESDAKTAAEKLITTILNAIKNQHNKFVSAGQDLVSKVFTGFDQASNSYYNNFYSAGANLASGFAEGISANSYLAIAKSEAMANAAYDAAMEALDAHSPSRKFMLIGEYADEGFAEGIDNNVSLSEEASKNMSENSMNVVATIVESGSGIVNEFLKGINQKLPSIPQAFINSLNNTILQIQSKYIDFKDSGESIATTFEEALLIDNLKTRLTKSLENAVEIMSSKYSSFESAGRSLSRAFASGLGSRGRDIRNAAIDLSNEAINIFLNAVRVIDLRILNELVRYTSFVESVLEKMVNATIEIVANAVEKISDIINEGCEDVLTITPVLDLSSAKADIDKLNSMFTSSQAMILNSSISKRESSNDKNDTISTPTSSNTISFTQNNYSPKSLSRSEIYRQTKNQFSAFERTVKV